MFNGNMDPFDLQKQFHLNSSQEDGYYHEYCRLYLANLALTNQVKELIQDKNQLMNRLSKYQDDDMITPSQRLQKSKRMRRNADEIERYYKCSIRTCGKSYGSQGSLNQHYKLKHPELYLQLPNVQCNLSQADEEFDLKSLKEEHDHKNHKEKECPKDKENKHRLVNNRCK